MASRTKRAARLDVVCFGEILWDIYEKNEKGARAPSRRLGAGVGARSAPIAREFRRELGGAPANVATVLARLGVRSAMIGGVGLDRFGEALTQHLEADGVDTRYLVRLPERTGLTFVGRDALGEPTFLFYRHDTADVGLRTEHVTPEMGLAKWALVGTSTMMTPSLAAATERFLAVAEAGGANLVVDLNVREHLWASKAQMRDAVARLVRGASVVKASFDDLVAITGRRDILWLADHAPKAVWIVTQGAKGASAIGDHGFVAMPALRAKCIDSTGAGDAFVAGVIAVLLAAGASPGKPAWRDERVWARALDVGHQLGAKAVSAVGAVTGIVSLGPVIARTKEAAQLAKSAPAREIPSRRRGARATRRTRSK
jgi:fructokinase